MGDEGRAEESEGNGDDQGSDSSGRNNPVIKRWGRCQARGKQQEQEQEQEQEQKQTVLKAKTKLNLAFSELNIQLFFPDHHLLIHQFMIQIDLFISHHSYMQFKFFYNSNISF